MFLEFRSAHMSQSGHGCSPWCRDSDGAGIGLLVPPAPATHTAGGPGRYINSREWLRLAPQAFGRGAGCWVIAGTWPPPCGSRTRVLRRVCSPSPMALCGGSSSPVALCGGSTSPMALCVGSPSPMALRVCTPSPMAVCVASPALCGFLQGLCFNGLLCWLVVSGLVFSRSALSPIAGGFYVCHLLRAQLLGNASVLFSSFPSLVFGSRSRDILRFVVTRNCRGSPHTFCVFFLLWHTLCGLFQLLEV